MILAVGAGLTLFREHDSKNPRGETGIGGIG